MKRYILFKNGTMMHTDLSKVGLTWTQVNNVLVSNMTTEERMFLDHYGLKPSIYNVANLRKFGKIVLSEPIAKRIIEEHKIPLMRN